MSKGMFKAPISQNRRAMSAFLRIEHSFRQVVLEEMLRGKSRSRSACTFVFENLFSPLVLSSSNAVSPPRLFLLRIKVFAALWPAMAFNQTSSDVADLDVKLTIAHGVCGPVGLKILVAVEIASLLPFLLITGRLTWLDVNHGSLRVTAFLLGSAVLWGIVSPAFALAHFVCAKDEPTAFLVALFVVSWVKSVQPICSASYKLWHDRRRQRTSDLEQNESDAATTSPSAPSSAAAASGIELLDLPPPTLSTGSVRRHPPR